MTKNIVKKNQSSLQVIKTLNVLLEDNYSMQNLIEILNKREKSPIFNNSVISKYINTCRFCGFKILKINNKYIVASMPFGMELSNSDINCFELLQKTAKDIFSQKTYTKFENLITKINKYANKYIFRVEKNTTNIIVEKFENAIAEKRKIAFILKNKEYLKCVPKSFTYKDDKIVFNVSTNKKEQAITSNKIIGLEILDEKSNQNFSEQKVVYKLTGGLAKRYSLRENETLLTDALPDYIVVSNEGEPRDELLSRLMRYDKLCTIQSPIEYKNAMIEMINKTLENYGE